MEKKIKIAGIATKAEGIKWFMLDNLRFAANNGFEPYIICEPSAIFDGEDLAGITYQPIPMQRGNVSLMEVLKSTWRLYNNFRNNRFEIVQYTSSNAGLYASIASWLARVPVRIYCQWGISYTDYTGFKLWFYKTMEKVTCMFSTDVQPDSFANLKFSQEEGLYGAKKGSVIHKGSANGVDMSRFDIANKLDWRCEIRKQYGISEETKVIGFVGRLVPEKGINELLESFTKLKANNTKLIIVGPYYEVERLEQELYNAAQQNPNIIFVGPVSNPAKYYAAFDFLTLPSYREGFGSVVLEAASMAVPTICSNIKGPTDFIRDGENGILCDVKSADSLYDALAKAITMTVEDYKQMSDTVYNDVKRDFDAKVFQKHFVADRIRLLKRHKVVR